MNLHRRRLTSTLVCATAAVLGVVAGACSDTTSDSSTTTTRGATAATTRQPTDAGKPTRTLEDLQTVLAGLTPGQQTTVDVTHPDGSKQAYRVTLGTL